MGDFYTRRITAAMKKVLSPNSDTMIIMSEEMKASAYPEMMCPPMEGLESFDALVAFLLSWNHMSRMQDTAQDSLSS